jgi:predicted transcriptional regulator of viral defense system
MNSIKLLNEMRKWPLFTINDLSRTLRKDESYVKVVANRLHKKGLINHIERGKYTAHEDAAEFASYIIVPSYISFWTALMMHGLTEQLPRDIMIASLRSKKDILFKGQRITFIKMKDLWGYSKTRYRDFDVFIAEKEKAIIDCLLAKNTPFDEIAKALSSRKADFSRLADYAKRAGNKTAAKRAGHLIERYGGDAGSLLEMVDGNYVPLDWAAGIRGKKDKRWKVIVNRGLDDI